jgi:hypothetical protein
MRLGGIAALLAGGLYSCAPSGTRSSDTWLSDRVPYARFVLTVTNRFENPWTGNDITFPEPRLVLELTQGHYANRASTAHANHDTVICLLPTNPQTRMVYHLSAADGNLLYDGFDGYDRWCFDDAKENSAAVTVLRLDAGQMTAEVKLDSTVKPVPLPRHKESEERRRVRANGGFFFETDGGQSVCTQD